MASEVVSQEAPPSWAENVPKEVMDYYYQCTSDGPAFSKKIMAEARPPIRRFSEAYCDGDTTGTFSTIQLPPVKEFLERRWNRVKDMHAAELGPDGVEMMEAACPEFLERPYLATCLVDLMKDIGDDPNFHLDKDRFPNLKILSDALEASRITEGPGGDSVD